MSGHELGGPHDTERSSPEPVGPGDMSDQISRPVVDRPQHGPVPRQDPRRLPRIRSGANRPHRCRQSPGSRSHLHISGQQMVHQRINRGHEPDHQNVPGLGGLRIQVRIRIRCVPRGFRSGFVQPHRPQVHQRDTPFGARTRCGGRRHPAGAGLRTVHGRTGNLQRGIVHPGP